MGWSKIDDLLPHHRKIVGAGRLAPAVFGYYVAGICFCQRHLTDGVILRTDLPLVLPAAPKPPEQILGLLESCRLWDRLTDGRDGWAIHDYLEHNESAAIRREKQAKDAARKRGGASGRTPGGVREDSDGTPNVAPLLSSPLRS
jgi:hypothetical protein